MIVPTLHHGFSLYRLGQGSLIDGTFRMYAMEESSSKENQDTVIKKGGVQGMVGRNAAHHKHVTSWWSQS